MIDPNKLSKLIAYDPKLAIDYLAALDVLARAEAITGRGPTRPKTMGSNTAAGVALARSPTK